MKNRKTIFLLIILPIILYAHSTDSNLALNVLLEKYRYQHAESIYGQIQLKNVSMEYVQINSRFDINSPQTLRLYCQSEAGTIYTNQFFINDYIANRTETLSAGDSIFITFNLLAITGQASKKDLFNPFELPPGKYRLHVEYIASPNLKNVIPGEQIKSNSIYFEVENEFNSDKNDYEMLIELAQKYQNIEKSERIKLLKSFIEKFPSSLYADIAYWHLLYNLSYYKNDIDSEYYEWVKRAYEKYHNSLFFDVHIRGRLLTMTIENMSLADQKSLELYRDFASRFGDSRGMKVLNYYKGRYKHINIKDY